MWLAPHAGADHVACVDSISGTVTRYNSWPSGFHPGPHGFCGAVNIGEHVWLVPHSASHLVRLHKASGQMTGYPVTRGYTGGIFDGRRLWLIPTDGALTRVEVETGQMSDVPWPEPFQGRPAFFGGTFDGKHLWLAPWNDARVVLFNVVDGSVRYLPWPGGKAVWAAGAICDGRRVWFAIREGERVVFGTALHDGDNNSPHPYPELPLYGAGPRASGSFQLTIVAARNLPKMDTFGSCDCYILVVDMATQAVLYKTKVVKDSCAPTFNEKVAAITAPCRLRIVAMDWDRFSKDDVIGDCALRIPGELPENDLKWCPLLRENGTKGEVGLVFSWS